MLRKSVSLVSMLLALALMIGLQTVGQAQDTSNFIPNNIQAGGSFLYNPVDGPAQYVSSYVTGTGTSVGQVSLTTLTNHFYSYTLNTTYVSSTTATFTAPVHCNEGLGTLTGKAMIQPGVNGARATFWLSFHITLDADSSVLLDTGANMVQITRGGGIRLW